MFSGARGNETNEVLNERKKETTESLRIGGIINHRLWQPDLSWSDSHRATYTYYVQEYSSISSSRMYVIWQVKVSMDNLQYEKRGTLTVLINPFYSLHAQQKELLQYQFNLSPLSI